MFVVDAVMARHLAVTQATSVTVGSIPTCHMVVASLNSISPSYTVF